MFVVYIIIIFLFCLLVFSINYSSLICFENIRPAIKADYSDTVPTTSQALLKKQFYVSGLTKLLWIEWKFLFLSREVKFIEFNQGNFLSINFKKRVSFALFFSGILISYLCMPLGFIVILYSFLYPVLFLNVLPTGLRVVNLQRDLKQSLPLDMLKGLITEGKPALPSQSPLILKEALQVKPLLSQADLSIMGIYILLAVIQRIIEGHIKFDDFLIFPVYLALPIISGRVFGSVSGLLSGFAGFLCVLSVMFPFPAFEILSIYPEVPTSLISTVTFGVLFKENILLQAIMQYIFILFSLSLLGFLSGFLSKKQFGHYLFPCPIILWIGVVALFKPYGLHEIHLYAQLALSMCWAIVVTAFLENRFKKMDSNSHDHHGEKYAGQEQENVSQKF